MDESFGRHESILIFVDDCDVNHAPWVCFVPSSSFGGWWLSVERGCGSHDDLMVGSTSHETGQFDGKVLPNSRSFFQLSKNKASDSFFGLHDTLDGIGFWIMRIRPFETEQDKVMNHGVVAMMFVECCT